MPQEDHAARITVGPQGRIVIPAGIREALGMTPGAVVAMRVEGRTLVLERPADVLARLRSEVRASASSGAGAVDQLIADRREAARREQVEHDQDR